MICLFFSLPFVDLSALSQVGVIPLGTSRSFEDTKAQRIACSGQPCRITDPTDFQQGRQHRKMTS